MNVFWSSAPEPVSAALVASRYAGQTWAADITERATRFARFNAALNGIANCTAVQGDLYEPLQGESFDRIVAHPPYMPALHQKYIFRDGGEDGEQITRRIIGGLPEHLGPGGRFYCTCMLTDRKEARAEARIRQMLGAAQDDFDVALVTLQTYRPTEYYVRLALEGRATLEEVAQRHEIFTRLEVDHLVYCSMVIQRRAEVREVFTARRQVGSGMGLLEMEWLLRLELALARPEMLPQLVEARPLVSSRTRLHLTHGIKNGEWVADECTLTTAWPFAVEARCSALDRDPDLPVRRSEDQQGSPSLSATEWDAAGRGVGRGIREAGAGAGSGRVPGAREVYAAFLQAFLTHRVATHISRNLRRNFLHLFVIGGIRRVDVPAPPSIFARWPGSPPAWL